jgi:hypothetical protein
VEHSAVLIGHYYTSATLKTAVARSSATSVINHNQHSAINTGVQTSNHRKQLDVEKPFVKAKQSYSEAVIQYCQADDHSF